MQLPENDYQILKLTPLFYEKFLKPSHEEILQKNNRAYNCLLFQTHYDYFIAVPYRSEIAHKYAYHFRFSKRSVTHKSGLDYTKIVIIDKNEYLETKDAIIDNDEYNETIRNFETIKKQVLLYVEDYINHVKQIKELPEKEFNFVTVSVRIDYPISSNAISFCFKYFTTILSHSFSKVLSVEKIL